MIPVGSWRPGAFRLGQGPIRYMIRPSGFPGFILTAGITIRTWPTHRSSPPRSSSRGSGNEFRPRRPFWRFIFAWYGRLSRFGRAGALFPFDIDFIFSVFSFVLSRYLSLLAHFCLRGPCFLYFGIFGPFSWLLWNWNSNVLTKIRLELWRNLHRNLSFLPHFALHRLRFACFSYIPGFPGSLRRYFWIEIRTSGPNSIIITEQAVSEFFVSAPFCLFGMCFACVTYISGVTGAFGCYFGIGIRTFGRKFGYNYDEIRIRICRYWPIFACVACVSPAFPIFRDFWTISVDISGSKFERPDQNSIRITHRDVS